MCYNKDIEKRADKLLKTEKRVYYEINKGQGVDDVKIVNNNRSRNGRKNLCLLHNR